MVSVLVRVFGADFWYVFHGHKSSWVYEIYGHRGSVFHRAALSTLHHRPTDRRKCDHCTPLSFSTAVKNFLDSVPRSRCTHHGRVVLVCVYQWYFSFKIHFSFYKFFSQSFLFLYYISIDLNNYLSFYNFLHQSFLFYIISVLLETIISVLSSFD